MRKLLLSLIVCLTLICGISSYSIEVNAIDETVYTRKIISVVYDNSGSMRDNDSTKWADAGYALQSFAALLNNNDSLFITDTNAGERSTFFKTEIDLSGDRQAQIDNLREMTAKSDSHTYAESIDAAYSCLKEKKADLHDMNAQYWLVVITDGKVYPQAKENAFLSADELHTYLGKLSAIDAEMSLQTVYMGINSATSPAYDLREYSSANFSAYFVESDKVSPDKSETIIGTMNTIANKISGRYLAKYTVDGTSVTIDGDSEISSIRNVAVFIQESSAKLVSATVDGKPLYFSNDSTATVSFPSCTRYNNEKASTEGGFVSLIYSDSSKADKIPSGDVKLVFDAELTNATVCIMFEPALKLDMTFSCMDASGNWTEVDFSRLSYLEKGNSLKVNYVIKDASTDKVVDNLSGIVATYLYNGVPVDNESISVAEGDSTFAVIINIPEWGYAINRSVHFTAGKRYYSVTGNEDNFLLITEILGAKTKGVRFKVEIVSPVSTFPVPEKDADKLYAKAKKCSDNSVLEGKLSFVEDGVLAFIPDSKNISPEEYTVSLFDAENTLLSEVKFSVVDDRIVYTIRAVTDSIDVNKYNVSENEACVMFAVFGNDKQLDINQLSSMLNTSSLTIEHNAGCSEKLFAINAVATESSDGNAAVIKATPCTVQGGSKGISGWFRNLRIMFGAIKNNPVTVSAAVVFSDSNSSAQADVRLYGNPIKILLVLLIIIAILVVLSIYISCIARLQRFEKGVIAVARIEINGEGSRQFAHQTQICSLPTRNIYNSWLHFSLRKPIMKLTVCLEASSNNWLTKLGAAPSDCISFRFAATPEGNPSYKITDTPMKRLRVTDRDELEALLDGDAERQILNFTSPTDIAPNSKEFIMYNTDMLVYEENRRNYYVIAFCSDDQLERNKERREINNT